MATRGWGGSIAIAIGVAAGTAAAALGVCYGLGIMAWTPGTDAAGERAWLASLTWTTWIAATSTVFGAVIADRLSAGVPGAAPPRRRYGAEGRVPAGTVANTAWRVVLAITAGVGGLLTVALVAVPARAAHRPDAFAPQMIAGGYAVVGVAVGVLVAVAALSARAVAMNVVLTTAYLWALAVGSVIFGYATRRELSTAQLGVWRFGGGHFLRQTFSLPGAALMMSTALVIGVLAAWPAVRRGDNRVGVAISGALGPLLVSSAYFLAAPKLIGAEPDEQLSAYLIAPYAVIAGLAGSVLLVGIAAQREQRAAALAAAGPAAPVVAPAPVEAPSEAPPPGEESLPDDAYAPARAYESGSGSGEEGPALVASPGPVPLWPTRPDSGPEEVTEKARPAKGGIAKRLGRR
ncbi:MAG: hypothetical protein AUI10_03540 [Actinobacteria bacterium 13_2_20CM_2_72_6]|nr:MAG: hypothetical protein AUI10_03540 [Actinobacteria bacterium 13_2_20CM_2_72_6]